MRCILTAILLAVTPTLAHDWKHPEYDSWYRDLRRPNPPRSEFKSCCSKSDCHTTDAELRNGDWWARIGQRNKGGWDLTEWKKVPPESVLQHQSNPTGEAVICHSNTPDQNNVRIWCFVPANES